ncbi:hypothetical protein BD560DRAFT_444155 [Blakeslea trispora]|nr:hypothetical protein BD560DRAFT_444155 [Blakeslea trispora]
MNKASNHLASRANLKDESNYIGQWLENEERSLNHLSDTIHQQTSKQFVDASCSQYMNQEVTNNTGPVINGVQLISTSVIPKPFQSVFKFRFFNVIQSSCFNDAFSENNNLVISAPTGSGKTATMELAIIRLLFNKGSHSKVIYMAPTKSLCSERVRDWQQKFLPLGFECNEFTGDTEDTSVAMLKKTSIIITTPEKWDAITRRSIDQPQWIQCVNLFLIDEVHILNEKRGACLEACVSRMKTMANNLRFIAISATVPNVSDIAIWLNAKPISFSEEYRPIKLKRFVYGYQHAEDNMFLFDRKLDWKLLDLIQKHSDNKPVLIFCSTRKSTQQACDTIARLMDKKNLQSLSEQPSPIHPFKEKVLAKYAKRGIGFHHAGLDLSDRSKIESLFMDRVIRVIATTSTLAVGVNLPAHLVIIKSTQGYQNGGLDEYSDIDLLQMIGRAGRPGLDTSGCAVIMTTLQMEQKYRSLISGTTNIESRLHENLIEHLVSELCLRTIQDESSALHWLQSTFLYVRVKQNPIHYKLNGFASSPDTILQEMCVKDLTLLEENKLIEKSANLTWKITPYGVAMDSYYIKFPTMLRILQSDVPTSIEDTLHLICESYEEMDIIRFNTNDRPFLNSLKNHENLRFPLSKVATVTDKIFILIQCVLGDISLYSKGNNLAALEAATVIKNVGRIVRCLIDCSVQERHPVRLKFALQLYQSIQTKLWFDTTEIALQIDGIGPQFAKLLAKANITSMSELRQCDPGRIEMILNRKPPFGTKVKKQIDVIPEFYLQVEQSTTKKDVKGVLVSLHVNLGVNNPHAVTIRKNRRGHQALFWIETSERQLIDFRRISLSKLHAGKQSFDVHLTVTTPMLIVWVHLQSEDYIGIDIDKEIQVTLDPKKHINVSCTSNVSRDHCQQPTASTSNELSGRAPSRSPKLEVIDLDPSPTISRDKGKGKACILADVKTEPADDFMPAKRKKKELEKPCKHFCKDKENCAHKCCKRTLQVDENGSTISLKRTFKDPEDLSPQKKLKTIKDFMIQDLNGAEPSSSATVYQPDKITPDDHLFDITDQDIMMIDTSTPIPAEATERPKHEVDDDFDSLTINDDDLDRIAYQAESCQTKQTRIDDCDALWHDVGDMADKAFNYHSLSSSQHTAQPIVIYQPPKTNQNERQSYSFKSSYLAEWIHRYVDII